MKCNWKSTKYIKIFGKEIGRYGWARFDIPAFSIKYKYEFAYKYFTLLGLTIIMGIKMLNSGEYNKDIKAKYV